MKKLKLLFVGDLLLSKDTIKIDKGIKRIFSLSDVLSCNLEGPVIKDSLEPIKKAGPTLKQSNKGVKKLLEEGFNLFSLANNHIMDYGEESLKSTISKISPELYLGAGTSFEQVYKLIVREIKGVKLGFLSFAEWGFGAFDTESKYGYAWINHPLVNKLVRDSKQSVDFLVVQCHAGVEDIELPIPEWRFRYKELIDNGADLIVGHHPHVVQGWEKYKEKYIFYSLGNFFMDTPKNKGKRVKGLMLQIELDQKLSLDYKVIPIEAFHNEVFLLKNHDFEKYLKTLSEMITSENYISRIEEISEELWKTRYKKFYLSSLNCFSPRMGIKYNLKVLRRFLVGKTLDYNLLLHNLKIESHRYVVERYLRSRLDEIDKK